MRRCRIADWPQQWLICGWRSRSQTYSPVKKKKKFSVYEKKICGEKKFICILIFFLTLSGMIRTLFSSYGTTSLNRFRSTFSGNKAEILMEQNVILIKKNLVCGFIHLFLYCMPLSFSLESFRILWRPLLPTTWPLFEEQRSNPVMQIRRSQSWSWTFSSASGYWFATKKIVAVKKQNTKIWLKTSLYFKF